MRRFLVTAVVVVFAAVLTPGGAGRDGNAVWRRDRRRRHPDADLDSGDAGSTNELPARRSPTLG